MFQYCAWNSVFFNWFSYLPFLFPIKTNLVKDPVKDSLNVVKPPLTAPTNPQKVVQECPKSGPKVTQKLPKSYPKDTQKIPKRYPKIPKGYSKIPKMPKDTQGYIPEENTKGIGAKGIIPEE